MANEINEKIESLDDEIQKYETQKRIADDKRRQYELAKKQKIKALLAEEAKLLPEKIALYKEILAWRDGFVKTEQFKRAFNALSSCTIFGSNWGHIKLQEFGSGGCWSRLDMDKSGALGYGAGFKWMGTGPRFPLKRNPETAKKLTYNYLKELHNAINTGKIYARIAKELSED